MANNPFSIIINAEEVANYVQSALPEIEQKLSKAAEELAIQGHAKIIEMANEDLKGWQRENFLGEGGENIRWMKASNNIYVVEVDEKVMHYSTGREPTRMNTDDWLLKNAKISKSGTKYKVIPFTHDTRGNQANVLGTMARQAIQRARTPEGRRISLRTIERNPDGTPKMGVLHKINIDAPLSRSQAPSLYSNPRSQETAGATGLQQHEGIFKLKGLVIRQRQEGARVKREAVTFRVVTDKAEGNRWIYPRIQPRRFIERCYEFLNNDALPQIINEIKQGLR